MSSTLATSSLSASNPIQGWPTNHAPASRHTANNQPRFQGIVGTVIGAGAISGLATDTAGILIPKLASIQLANRGHINWFEEIVLEGLENIAFYFAVPVIGLFAASRGFAKLLEKGFNQAVTRTELGHGVTEAILKNRALIGAKAGVLLSSVAVAAGLEYLVPHIKNLMTVATFKAKNFTAVANLEERREIIWPGESDPVAKAKSRFLPVALAVGGTIGLSLLLPLLATRTKAGHQAAQFLVKHFGFAKDGNVVYDLSKPILAVLALVGLGGYMDASRDKLELKETTTRVAAFTIPYYLFGKELAGNFLGRLFENQSVTDNGATRKIKDIVSFVDPKLSKESFLDLNKVVNGKYVSQVLDAASGISPEAKYAILGKHQAIWYGKYLLSAAVVGVIANLFSFAMTRKRFEHQQQQKLEAAAAAFNRYPKGTLVAVNENSPFAAANQNPAQAPAALRFRRLG